MREYNKKARFHRTVLWDSSPTVQTARDWDSTMEYLQSNCEPMGWESSGMDGMAYVQEYGIEVER